MSGAAAADPPTTRIPRIKPAIAAGSPPVAGRPSASEPTRAIPVVDVATGHPAPVASGRPAGTHIHRQVWNGTGWVLADDDRVFHPARADRPATTPADDTAVFRPPDPPPWADHGRPETRTTRWHNTVDYPRRNP